MAETELLNLKEHLHVSIFMPGERKIKIMTLYRTFFDSSQF